MANTKKSGAAKTASAPRKPKAKNLDLPHTTKKIAAIEEAAESYAAVRDERMDLTEQEVQAKEKLLGLMKKHGVEIYRLDEERVAIIEHEVETVRVKKMSVEQAAKRAKKDAEAAAE